MIAPPAGQDPGTDRVDQVALGGGGRRLRGEDRLDLVDPLTGQGPVEGRRGQDLDQVRSRSTDGDDLAWSGVRGIAYGVDRSGRIASTSAGVGGSWVTNRPVSMRRPDPQPCRARRPVGIDDDELGAAATDIDDERLLGDRHPLGDADDRQERLLLVRHDVEWGAAVAVSTSWTTAAASAARRIGSVPRNVTSVAPRRRAVSA